MDFDEMEIRKKKKKKTNIEFQNLLLLDKHKLNNRFVIFIYGLFIRRIYSFSKRNASV